MDFSTVFSSVLSALAAIVVCLITQKTERKKAEIAQEVRLTQIQAQHEQTVAIITCKLDELDRKQAIHNSVIDRVYKLENFTNLLSEKNTMANANIEALYIDLSIVVIL